jgi:glucose/mannose-6-phosphate isomerase
MTDNILVTESDIANLDQQRLYAIYQRWPDYFKEAAEIPCNITHDPDFYDSVVLCGMGGSATSCDIINDILHYSGCKPSVVIRGQNMPTSVGKHSLVIVNSASGNTEEAISMMEQASDKNADVFCISSGGILEEKAKRRGNGYIRIPNISLPRASLPYLLVPALKLINPFLKSSLEKEISEIPRRLSAIARNISVSVPEESNVAKKIASFLNTGFAFSLTSPVLCSVGNRFKNSLNENAKVHCIEESILEASHNEIVPFTYINSSPIPKVILLSWTYDCAIVRERFKKINSFFTEIGQTLMEINAFDDDLINAIVSSIYILDYSTIYMAISRGIDPSPTPAIDIIKKK